MANIELYINQIKKLYPNIVEEELNKMVEYFKADMEKQAGRYRENELDGTYRELSPSGLSDPSGGLREGWVKVVPGSSIAPL